MTDLTMRVSEHAFSTSTGEHFLKNPRYEATARLLSYGWSGCGCGSYGEAGRVSRILFIAQVFSDTPDLDYTVRNLHEMHLADLINIRG